MDLGQLSLLRLSRAGPTFVGPCISSSARMGAGVWDLSCAVLGLCQVPPCSVAALRGWSLPRFLLQYRKHQHKLPNVVGAEVCTAQGVVLCL